MDKKSLLDQVRKTPESWIYILIGVANIKYFPSNIQEKFKNQTAMLAQAIAQSGSNAEEVAQALKDAVKAKYGMTTTELLKEMASGNNVFAKDIAGVCAVPMLEECDVDPVTGFPVHVLAGIGDTESYKTLLTKPTTVGGYTSVGDNETGKITAVYNVNTGAQVSSRQPDGSFDNKKSTGKENRNFWNQLCQVLGELAPFLAVILKLLGLYKEYDNENTSALQSDGWWGISDGSSSNSSSGIMTLALAAGAIYLISSNNKKH